MTFLQPILLWGLPLVLLPVIIHLINRVRHRPRAWAAMLFLQQAHRASTRLARLREWLILTCRMLALLALILALARPFTGGWLGWLLAGRPDTVVVLFDRSASMETQVPGTAVTRRQRAVQRLAEAGKRFSGKTRFVLLDSLTRQPRYLPSATVFEDSALLAGTETGANLLAMLQAAFDLLTRDNCGHTEIWIVSDLQVSDWRPGSPEWQTVTGKFKALPQKVVFRVLALDTEAPDNAAVRVLGVQHATVQGKPALSLSFEVRQAAPRTRSLPLTVCLGSQTTTLDLTLASTDAVFRQFVPVENADEPVWGWVELPRDQNPSDNRSCFACGPAGVARALVAAVQPEAGRVLTLAAAPMAAGAGQAVQRLAPDAALLTSLKDIAMVVWQAPVPAAESQGSLKSFVENGGVLLCLPPGTADTGTWFGDLGWQPGQNAQADTPWRIDTWNDEDGPLARTAAGTRLPVDQLTVLRRQVPRAGPAVQVLATFKDGEPFLVRRMLGRGAVVAGATLPAKDWSDLAQGLVLLPLVQRLAADGLRRFDPVEAGECGVSRPFENLVPLSAGKAAGAPAAGGAAHSGVFRRGDGFLVLNRPAVEDVPGALGTKALGELFQGLVWREFHDRGVAGEQAQAELWPAFLVVLLLALATEGWLTAQPRADRAATGRHLPESPGHRVTEASER